MSYLSCHFCTVFPAAPPPPSVRIIIGSGFHVAGGGSLRLTGLDCPKNFFFTAILVLMRHMSVDIPISCPRLLAFFFCFFFPCRRFVLPHNLSRTWPDFSVRGHVLLWGLAGAHPVFHHLSWEHASLYSTKKKKSIQRYSESNSSGGLTEHVIWEGGMYMVWLRTRVCFTWKFPPCERTNNPTRLVNLADYQLANELMMEILYKWGTMLRSNVSTFKNEAHSPEHKGVFECEGCGTKTQAKLTASLCARRISLPLRHR